MTRSTKFPFSDQGLFLFLFFFGLLNEAGGAESRLFLRFQVFRFATVIELSMSLVPLFACDYLYVQYSRWALTTWLYFFIHGFMDHQSYLLYKRSCQEPNHMYDVLEHCSAWNGGSGRSRNIASLNKQEHHGSLFHPNILRIWVGNSNV